MNAAALEATLILGAITRMRSIAGLAAVAVRPDSAIQTCSDGPGNCIDPIPLAGRAVAGALVGGVIARQEHGNILVGAADPRGRGDNRRACGVSIAATVTVFECDEWPR